MSEFKKFSCGECGGTVEMVPSRGQTLPYVRGYEVPIPDGFEIPICKKCGEIYIITEIEKDLWPLLKTRFLQMQAAHYRELTRILVERHGVKHHDIVRACGITPAYMSHVLNGKRVASTTLTRLLEAFVACGAEFERHRQGQHWSVRDVAPYAVKATKVQGAAKVSWHGHGPPQLRQTPESKQKAQLSSIGQAA